MIREQAFWFFDKIKGGPIKKSLEEVTIINKNPFSNESIYLKEKYLKSILIHANSTTEFYKSIESQKKLEKYPVINKNLIRDNYQIFQSKKYNISEQKKISTSGSTGTPFSIHHCKNKVIRNYADNFFFSNLGGYKIGFPFYYLRVWNEINKRSLLGKLLQNIHPIDISDLSDNSMRSLVNVFNHLPKNSILLGYGSTFDVLVDYLKENKPLISDHIKSIFVMSEPVSLKTRNFLSKTFNCSVLARYSNSENGFLAHQWSLTNDDYIINSASYHIELFDLENDFPVEDGNPGRVIVTDLFNYAVPIIRYDTGDIAVKEEKKIDGIPTPVFRSIEGRKLDFIYNTDGGLISPHTIDYAVRTLTDLIQFQIIQNSAKNYTLKLLLKQQQRNIEDQAIKSLKHYLGFDAEINVVFVDEIPILNSGKRKIVVNNYTKK